VDDATYPGLLPFPAANVLPYANRPRLPALMDFSLTHSPLVQQAFARALNASSRRGDVRFVEFAAPPPLVRNVSLVPRRPGSRFRPATGRVRFP
jgi:hypothetical protein